MSDGILYSAKYCDDTYEYRHVILPKSIARTLQRDHLMSESEWRGIGVQMGRGWIHYLIHRPEPHVLLFRRPKSSPDEIKIVPMDCDDTTLDA